MKVKEFVNKFVAHNSTVCIYNQKRVHTKDNGFYYEFVPLWSGMDWQVTDNKEDMEYCKRRGFETISRRRCYADKKSRP